MTINGNAILAGVVGWPVGHSLSPRLHGYWLDEHGIDGAYVPLAVTPENFAAAVGQLPHLGFAGANVTVPHKEAALDLIDRADDNARRIGAVNTLVVESDGGLAGSNSDGFGFRENLKAGHPEWRAEAGPAIVLGAGGAARAIVDTLLEAGAPEVRVVNRTAGRAEALARDIGGAISIVAWQDLPGALDNAALLVNATTLGMHGKAPLELDLRPLPATALVNDIVYTPLETPLLSAARARGNPVVDGLGMLLHQARPGFAAWFGIEPTVTPELRDFVIAGLGD